eukprot:gene10825-14515_t
MDTALKIALAYHRANGQAARTRLIGRERGYHGVGFGGTSVGGMVNNRRAFSSAQLPGVDHIRHTYDLARNAFSKDLPEHGAELADDVERMVALHGAETIAAVIVEPVPGSTGVLPPPAPDFYRLSEIEQTYRGGSVALNERRPLMLSTRNKAPTPELRGASFIAIRAKFADDVGVPASHVVIAGERGPLSDRNVGRVVRYRAAQGISDRDEHILIAPFQLGVQQPDGRWKVIQRKPVIGLNSWQRGLALWFSLSALAMAPVAWIFARRLTKPIQEFANAAERLGRDPGAPPLELRGPPGSQPRGSAAL